MNIRSGLAGVGAAMVFGLAAQAAEASSIQCPVGGEGGGVQQIQVGQDGEPCEPLGGYTTVTTTGLDATGASYTAALTFEGPDEYLAIGEYVEVEIDLDTVTAALRANPKAAVELASAIGIREGKSGVVHAANVISAKLTDAEYAEVANYVRVHLQNRVTGRSDTATNNTTSRIEAGLQAFDRVVRSIGGAIRSAIMPNIRAGAREKIQRPDGTVIQREMHFELS
jgi:hypothetical protein